MNLKSPKIIYAMELLFLQNRWPNAEFHVGLHVSLELLYHSNARNFWIFVYRGNKARSPSSHCQEYFLPNVCTVCTIRVVCNIRVLCEKCGYSIIFLLIYRVIIGNNLQVREAGLAAFHCNWTGTPRRFRILLLIYLTKSTRETYIEGLSFYVVKMETMADVRIRTEIIDGW